MCETFAISASDLTILDARITGEASTNDADRSDVVIRRQSDSGMRISVSGPIGTPTVPAPAPNDRISATRSETPSSSGVGAGHDRISSIQVRSITGTPISGMTATGDPSRGLTRYPVSYTHL